MAREEIMARIRAHLPQPVEMPDLSEISATVYSDPLQKFIETAKEMGAGVIEADGGTDPDTLIRNLFPDARHIASSLPEIRIADRNPDLIDNPADLDGTDVGVIRGEFGVAENACVWVPQTMKQKAVCFISENLVILLSRSAIVSNMHEGYGRVNFTHYNFGTFISGPSKTADIAQVLVMGAQAARTLTIILLP